MTPGFVGLQRKFFDHWLWSEKREFSKAEAFLDLIQSAAFGTTTRLVRGTLLTVSRGETVASIRYLGARWGWKKDKVLSFVRLLESQTMARRETRQGETVIILLNYDLYNSPADTKPDTHPTHNQTRTRHAPDSDQTNKNNGNNGTSSRERENAGAGEPNGFQMVPPPPPIKPDPLAETALQIAESYARRDHISDALTIVLADLRGGCDPEAMLKGTKACSAVIRTGPGGVTGKYVPSALAFFRDKRWMDDPATIVRPREMGGQPELTHAEQRKEAAKSVDPGIRAKFEKTIKVTRSTPAQP